MAFANCHLLACGELGTAKKGTTNTNTSTIFFRAAAAVDLR
jgi:hypothetical protein